MDPMTLFWLFLSSMLIVFGVDVIQKRRNDLR